MGTLAIIGGLIALVGWIWTIISAFQTGGALWGVINIIPIQPIIGIITAAMKKVPWTPIGVMLLGVVIQIVGNVMAW